jgi:hypothetical protein
MIDMVVLSAIFREEDGSSTGRNKDVNQAREVSVGTQQ